MNQNCLKCNKKIFMAAHCPYCWTFQSRKNRILDVEVEEDLRRIRPYSHRGLLLELKRRLSRYSIDKKIEIYRDLRKFGEALRGDTRSRKESMDEKIQDVIDSL